MSTLPTNFSASPRRQLIRSALVVSGLICVISGWTSSLDTGSDRTLWVIDNSLSMAVTDIGSQSGILLSRLDFAKQIVSSGSRVRSGEQGIMSAAGWARLEMAMTDNMWVFSDTTRGITIDSQGGGSSVSTPLEMIRLIYGNTSHLQVFWITDGEFSDSWSSLSLWTTTPSITLIGVGTRSGWPILLGYDTDGRPRYKESDNKRVNSIRDDARLASVAESLDADLIFLDSPSDLTRIAKSPNSNTIPPYLMMIGTLLIVAWLMISRFRYTTKTWK